MNVPPETCDDVNEQRIRTTLRSYAPTTVDTEHAWAVVRPQLFDRPRQVKTQTGPSILPALLPARRRAVSLVLAGALLLVSAGFIMGFVYVRACFAGGTDFLCSDIPQLAQGVVFQPVNQQQERGGVTITITSAYADRGATLVAFTVTLAPDLVRRYVSADPVSMTVTSATGEQAAYPPADGRGTLCDAPERTGGVTTCYARFGPLHPGSWATHVAMTVVIPTVALHNGARTATEPGPWHFQFTLVYHQQDHHVIDLPPVTGPSQSTEATPSQ